MATESKQTPGTRTVNAAEFKAKCLKLMDEVAESGEELVITKNGRPVSRLVPYREKPKSWLSGATVTIILHSRRYRLAHAARRGTRTPRMLIRTEF